MFASNASAGLTVNSLNHPNAAAISVIYEYSPRRDTLTFGGSIFGGGAATYTDDFFFTLENASGTPVCTRAIQTLAGSSAAPLSTDCVVTTGRKTSKTFNISATGFGGPPFADPLAGSFTLTFNQELDRSYTVSDLVVNSLNHPNASAISVIYEYSSRRDTLTFGGSILGGGAITGTDDFFFTLENASGTPVCTRATQTLAESNAAPLVTDCTVSTGAVVAVSEPASAALASAALFGLGALRRRAKPGVPDMDYHGRVEVAPAPERVRI